MTVQGAASLVADVDLAAAEQRFNDIYAMHAGRVRNHVYFRLPLDLTHLTDDFMQETFLDLWLHLAKGKPVDKPFGLLRAMANQNVLTHFMVRSNTEYLATDFEDPKTSSGAPAGHRYAATDPVLALLSTELDAAMECMRDASEQWRELHRKAYMTSQRLKDGHGGQYRTDASKAKLTGELEQLVNDRDVALKRLQRTCGAVGQLRSDLERAGGNWRSSTGLPSGVSADGKARQGTVASDVTVTECPKGHDLTVDTVVFLEDGTRRCRRCQEATRMNRQSWASHKGKRTARNVVHRDVIDAAGRALFDPANANRSTKDIATEYKVHVNTLHRNFPNLADQRSEAARAAGIQPKGRHARPHDNTIAAARTLLADPSNAGLTLKALLERAGITEKIMRSRIPDYQVLRQSAREAAAR